MYKSESIKNKSQSERFLIRDKESIFRDFILMLIKGHYRNVVNMVHEILSMVPE